MSYSTVYGLWPGTDRRAKLAELRNSWGSAPVIWNAMAQRYLGCEPHAYSQRLDDLWPLHERADIPQHHRTVLRMTFDTRYVLYGDRIRAIDDIAFWLHDFGHLLQPGAVNHWPAIADLFVRAWSPRPEAFGIWHTSVSPDTWLGSYSEERDERLPFDWDTAASVYAEEIPHE